jgi:hypothetical protein
MLTNLKEIIITDVNTTFYRLFYVFSTWFHIIL